MTEEEIPQIQLLMYLYEENVYQRTQIQLLIGMVCTLMALHDKEKGDEFMRIFDSVPTRVKDELANIGRVQPFYDALVKKLSGISQN